jgi:hypothetical protein
MQLEDVVVYHFLSLLLVVGMLTRAFIILLV